MRFRMPMLPTGHETAAPDTTPEAERVTLMYSETLQKAAAGWTGCGRGATRGSHAG